MSPRRMRGWAAAAIAALVALTIETGQERERVRPLSPVPAVDNPDPQGLEAAFLYLSALGQARTLEGSFESLTAADRVLITAQPYARPVEAAEQTALLDWVNRGGTLVIAGEHSGELPALEGLLAPRFVALHLNDRSIGLTELGRDMRSLIQTATAAPQPDLVPARAAVSDPLLAGVSELAVSPDRGFDVEPGSAVPILVAGDTPVGLALERGRGRILVLAGPDVLTNARIDRADNLQLLANLAALGPVVFDEYHHRESLDRALAAFIRAFGPPLLAALAAVLLLTLALGRRVGPPIPAAAVETRTSRDYAEQLGRLYRRAHAEPALARDLRDQLRASALRKCHLPAGSTEPALVAALQHADPAAASRYQALIAALGDSPRILPAKLAELTRAAVAWKHGR